MIRLRSDETDYLEKTTVMVVTQTGGTGSLKQQVLSRKWPGETLNGRENGRELPGMGVSRGPSGTKPLGLRFSHI